MGINVVEIKAAGGKYTKGNQKTLTRVYKVWTTGGNYTNAQIRAKFRNIGTPDVDDSNCKLTDIDVNPGDGPRIWDVTESYDNQFTPQDNQQEQPEQSPWESPATFDIDFREKIKVLYQDYSSPPKSILNSAGQLFADPVTGERAIQILNVQNNIQFPNWSLLRDYQFSVNSDNFLGGAPGTVKMKCKVRGPSYKQTSNNVYEYWQASWVFEYDMDGWQEDVMDMGMDELIDGQAKRIKDITSPVKLDGEGKRLSEGAEPYYHKFKRYREKPYRTLINNLNFTWFS